MKKIKLPPSQVYNASIVYTFFKYKFKNIEFTIDNNTNKSTNYTHSSQTHGQPYPLQKFAPT